jgi:hypothetical protein
MQQVCATEVCSVNLTHLTLRRSSADERPPCGVCEPKLSGFQFCRHLVDPENHLFYKLTVVEQKWDHSKAMQALDAYADFLTLKVLEQDYNATLLLPTDIIDQVRRTSAGRDPPVPAQREEVRHVVRRCGARIASSVGCTSPAWTASLTASTSTTSRPTP